MPSPVKTAASLLIFAAVALLYPIGCGPPCGSGVEFDYSEDDMRQHLEPLASMEQTYAASNERGVLELTLTADQSSLAQVDPTGTDLRQYAGPSFIRSASACSVASGQMIVVDTTITATFTPTDGDEQLLVSDRVVRTIFRVDGYDRIDNGTLRMEYADDLSFELETDTGEVDAFELTQFWSQGNDAATIGYGR